MRACWTVAIFVTVFPSVVRADGPADNLADRVRPIPPRGIEVPVSDRKELEAGLERLHKDVDILRKELAGKPSLDLLPDVLIYDKAVRWALAYNEFFNAREIPIAKVLLRQGIERARLLHEGKAPWTAATGLVVRGYVSKIDGSVQPYGLVVPASYHANTPIKHRLDTWFHGRGETLNELNFLADRERTPGKFTPKDTLVLHPYGRYCNANKFAGEVDLFEALTHVTRHYPIDVNRIAVRGFSMGGAACWQYAVHYAGLWAAAAPGAGFSETPDFLRVFQNEPTKPAPYEEKLLHLYDCTDWAINLYNCPTVAYSGEIDKQKQAADMMAKAMAAEGVSLVHIIGPKTAHDYHPQAVQQINQKIDSILAVGRDPVPKRVRFTTWTLRYNQMLWVRVDALDKHWERARVDAEITGPSTVEAKTQNVSALSFGMAAGHCPLDNTQKPKVTLDGQPVAAAPVLSDRSWVAHFRKNGEHWEAAGQIDETGLQKRHGLQGPIDDAFMDSFLMVRPTGTPFNEKIGAWAAAEMKHAVDHWRRQFRGDARVKDDSSVSDADIAAHNLVLWGDPSSNKLLAKIADKLPIHWDAQSVHVGAQTYSGGVHVPVLIYPNPLNPRRYVVLNSGFTFREYDYLNNARQIPRLPDYAVIDISVPVSSKAPGGIVTAGFFDEHWQLGREEPRRGGGR